MNEPSVFLTENMTMPDDVQHRIDEPGFTPRIARHMEIHNVFGMENSRATYEGLLKLNLTCALLCLLVRLIPAANATQPHGRVITLALGTISA